MMLPEKKPRKAIQVRCKDEQEVNKFHQIANSRGMNFSDMVRKDYLGTDPRVNITPPDREKLIKMIVVIGQIVSSLDKNIAKFNPENKKDINQIKGLNHRERDALVRCISAREGALFLFLEYQSQLNGRNQG